MQLWYILLGSAAFTGGIVYLIYRVTRGSVPDAVDREIAGLDIEIEEDFLGDVDGEFQGTVYKSSRENVLDKPQRVYPSCFGTLEIYRLCRRNCNVLDECTSTVKILEVF